MPRPAVEFLIFGVVIFLTSIHCGCSSSSTTFALERIGSTSNEKFIDIVARDRIRHAHIFQSSLINGVVNYPLQGSSDSYIYGYYFTKVKLGNPPREYNLLIDTGSDITWVKCNPCNGCTRTGTSIETSFFDPHSSYSAEPVSCSGHICKAVAQSHGCSSSNSVCTYSIPYEDTSSSSGYYVADSFHFDTINGNSAMANYSATIVFGCTTNLSGTLADPQIAVDGIFGLGKQRISVISQLASRELTPDVFSHCLNGDAKGGGILVFGKIVEPGIVYTPLVPSQPHYSLNLLSISISGQTVSIHQKVFATSTIVDSGTTYAYLAEEAYDPFITALVAAVPPSVNSFSYEGNQCFQVSSSLRNVFPVVSLNFAAGASMALKPEEYLKRKFVAGPGVWCVGFLKNQGPTILGELVLKDKIIIYDLAQQRLGWAEYNCSSSVNVSLVPPRVSSSSRAAVLYPFFTGSLCMILMFFFGPCYAYTKAIHKTLASCFLFCFYYRDPL